jgi:cysteine desulfuration protein SufE
MLRRNDHNLSENSRATCIAPRHSCLNAWVILVGTTSTDPKTIFPSPLLSFCLPLCQWPSMTALSNIHDEYDFLDNDDRYRLLIDLGKALPPMPDALKTDATLVRGCSASVWVYPVIEDEKLLFLADSNAAITKGIIALVVKTIEGLSPKQIVATDIADILAPFNLQKQLSSNRTQGIPNMIALIQETATRYAD